MLHQRMLCLANSRKFNGRCVAGLLADGSWMRPVTATEDGSLAPAMCMLDIGRPVQSLDVVLVSVEYRDPRLHQPENWIVADGPWRFLRTRNLSEVRDFLDGVLTDDPELLGTRTNKVTWAELRQNPPSSSLALVKAARPVFTRNPHKRSQRRARFKHHGSTYDLPITFDIELPDADQDHRSASDWYFTISLGEPWEEQGSDCFKLVAGALEAPA